MLKQNPEVPEGIVPLSVADMELKNPPEITEGLKQFLDHRILGYTDAGEDYYTETVNCSASRCRHGDQRRRPRVCKTG